MLGAHPARGNRRLSASALRAARAYDVSPNPWNVVKAQRALTQLIDSISPRFNGLRNTMCCVATKDCCAPRANAHYHQVLLAVCLGKSTRQAWFWPILYRNIGNMVACELTGDSGGIGKPTHVKLVRPLSCSSSVTVFAKMFSKVLCGPRVECKTQELKLSSDWSCAKLVGRTMGLCKMDVTGTLVKGSSRKCSDRGQLPTVSENESRDVLGACPGELDEMGLEDALGAIIEEHQGQISSSDDLPKEVNPDLDALHSDAEIAKVFGNDCQLSRLAVRCA